MSVFFSIPVTSLVLTLGGLSLLIFFKDVLKLPARAEAYLKHLWIYFLVFSVAEFLTFSISVWILAAVCFMALREYFSLIDIRFQDRWGLWGAYCAIPFMAYFIQVDWYGMFIISIPIYTFLIIPFLVALGGVETEGTVFSVGAIDFGLFLFVYCTGHIGYLMLFSTWAAVLLVLNVTISDGIAFLLSSSSRKPWTGNIARYLIAIPFTASLTVFLRDLTGVPWQHSLIIGIMIPILVAIGRYTMTFIETDLGIAKDYEHLRRGRMINSSCSLLFAAPVIFHYIRYFLS
jgi:phosphatidate cytidylyltransferase